jgi:hypothetical protein
MGTRNMRRVRHGYVLGFFLFCLTMEPVYARLRAALGEEGSLLTYCDDSYLLAETDKMAEVLHQALAIFDMVGLRIGLGPVKTKLLLPRSYDRSLFPYPLDSPEIPATHVVQGFSSRLRVPRHYTNDQEFITFALKKWGKTRPATRLGGGGL